MSRSRMLVPALLVMLLTSASPAQKGELQYDLPINVPKEQAPIHLQVLLTPGRFRSGGRGFMRIEARNSDSLPHSVDFDLELRFSRQSEFRVHKGLRLEGKERATLFLPMPGASNTSTSLRLGMSLDKGRSYTPNMRVLQTTGLACLCLSSDPGSGKWLKNQLDASSPPFIKGTKLELLAPVHVRSAREIPRSWQLLSGFDLITVELSGGELKPETQTVLADYMRMGGRLLLLGDPGSPESVLGRILGTRPNNERVLQGSRGFGNWLWAADRDELALQKTSLQIWLTSTGFFLSRAKKHSGSAPDEFYKRLDIPGLGQVPVRLFFFLILVFAVVIGPVNLLYWRRKKKPQMLLVSVPIAGVAFTAMILIYGFVAEGFEIEGSIRSMTILDQRDHSSANITQRSLFAGMGPDKLDLDPGTHLDTADRVRSWRDPLTHVIDMDLDQGNRLAGTILPSRTETNLVTWTLSKTRERLAFKRDNDGRYRIIETGGLARNAEDPTVVFRDIEGKYWVSTGSGPELTQDGALASQAMKRLLQRPQTMEYSATKRRRNRSWYYYTDQEINQFNTTMKKVRQPGTQLKLFVANNFFPSLPHGSYLLRAQVDPSVDDLGLEINYGSSIQLVMGLLAKEDIQ